LTGLAELIGADVDAVEFFDHVPDRGVVFFVHEMAGEGEHLSIEIDLGIVAGACGQFLLQGYGKVGVVLRERGSAGEQGGDKDDGDAFCFHGWASFAECWRFCWRMVSSVLLVMRSASMTCARACSPAMRCWRWRCQRPAAMRTAPIRTAARALRQCRNRVGRDSRRAF